MAWQEGISNGLAEPLRTSSLARSFVSQLLTPRLTGLEDSLDSNLKLEQSCGVFSVNLSKNRL